MMESNYNTIQLMSASSYMDMLQNNFLHPTPVVKNWSVPRYFKFYFQLLNQGDKNFICEHDIFVFIQELEGMAPAG